MLGKRLFCLHSNIDRLQKMGRLHLWTFTRKEAEDYSDTRAAWNRLLTYLKRYFQRRGLSWSGIRVYEVHPGKNGGGSHGIHVHVVCNKRYDVNIVRDAAIAAGWGRIHVARVRPGAQYYVAKYLGKKRPEALKHWRLTSTFGMPERTLISDIVVDSLRATLMRLSHRLYPDIGWGMRLEQVTRWWHRIVAGERVGAICAEWGYRVYAGGRRFWEVSPHAVYVDRDLKWGFMARQSPNITPVVHQLQGCWGVDLRKTDLVAARKQGGSASSAGARNHSRAHFQQS